MKKKAEKMLLLALKQFPQNESNKTILMSHSVLLLYMFYLNFTRHLLESEYCAKVKVIQPTTIKCYLYIGIATGIAICSLGRYF